jgi:hypothetical protein
VFEIMARSARRPTGAPQHGIPAKMKQAGERKFSGLLLKQLFYEQPRLSPQFRHL